MCFTVRACKLCEGFRTYHYNILSNCSCHGWDNSNENILFKLLAFIDKSRNVFVWIDLCELPLTMHSYITKSFKKSLLSPPFLYICIVCYFILNWIKSIYGAACWTCNQNRRQDHNYLTCCFLAHIAEVLGKFQKDWSVFRTV